MLELTDVLVDQFRMTTPQIVQHIYAIEMEITCQKQHPYSSSMQDVRGTQRIVSVNYLFGRPLITYDFLKGIFTSNFRDMGK